jgi:tetratricopeptide (TPR) repeat protein
MKIFKEVYFSESKRDNVKEKLNQIIGLRPDDNAIYFVCFIYFLMGEKYNPGNKKVEQLKLDTISDQKNYSVIGNNVLEALLIENDDKKTASAKFFEAGWRYYWLNKLSDATYFLQRAHELVDRREIENDLAEKKELDVNYSLWFYYADTLRMISRTNQPPYIDNKLIQKASEIIFETGCRKKLLHDSTDSWFYLVAARIHCDRFLFASENMLDEYWQAIVYTEWALFYKKKDYMAFTDLAKYYLSIRLYNVALENFKFVLEINKQEAEEYSFFLEHYAICLMELRMLADAGVIINKLKKLLGEAGEKEYLHWEGYVDYLSDNYEEAIKKIDEYINDHGEDIWSLYIKMMSLLFNPSVQNIEGARTIASKIVSIEPEKYPDRVFEFAWADLVLGNIDTAIGRLEENCKRVSLKNYESHTLSQLYLIKGDDLKAEENFKFYIQYEFSIQDVKIFEKEIAVIAKLFKKENHVIEKLNLWKELILGKIRGLEKENVTADWEFESFLKEFDLKVENPLDKLSLPLIAHYLRLARKKWDEGYKERAR